jgi:hypothetical protein
VLAILDKPVVPGVTTCDVVELVREQLVVRVKMVEHKGHILLESRGDDDVENDEEEVNAVISECLPLVYDAGDIVDIEDLVVVLGDRAGDLCDEHLLEGVGAANAVGGMACDGDHRGGVEQHGDDVGGAGPRGDDVDPNTFHECATSVGEGVVGAGWCSPTTSKGWSKAPAPVRRGTSWST